MGNSIDPIEEYHKNIQEPWFRLMYDVAYRQLNISSNANPPLNILDFGSGFGVTANYYAQWHNVTAVEPNPQMSDKRFCDNKYTQVTGGIEILADYPAESFDVIICHNVLEYANNKEEIFGELARILKSGGIFSLLKHNKYGKIMHSAVFEANPKKAIDLFSDNDFDLSPTFGDRKLYTLREVSAWTKKYNLTIDKILGLRTFFCLIQDNSVKYNSEWYQKMIELEIKAGEIDEYINIAFLHHLIIQK